MTCIRDSERGREEGMEGMREGGRVAESEPHLINGLAWSSVHDSRESSIKSETTYARREKQDRFSNH